MELLDQLDFKAVGREFDIPEWQKNITLKRLKSIDENPESAVDFDEMLNRIESEYGL